MASFDAYSMIEELKRRFNIEPPEWAVDLVEMKATISNQPSSGRVIGGREEHHVVCYWLVPSDRVRLQSQGDGEFDVSSSHDVWNNPYAIAITEYREGGRITSIEFVSTSLTPSPPPVRAPSPEHSIERLGAALKEIASEQGQE